MGLELYLFHHLSDDTIGKHDDGIAIAESQLETEVDEVGHFLYAVGGKYNRFVVTVTTTAGSLVIVTLRRLDRAQTRSAALYVDDERRDFGADHITNAFLHEGYTYAGR